MTRRTTRLVHRMGDRADRLAVRRLCGGAADSALHVLVASSSDAAHGQEVLDTAGENVVVTETRVRIPLGPPLPFPLLPAQVNHAQAQRPDEGEEARTVRHEQP